MKISKTILKQLLGRKLAVIILITASAAGAFATLGDGKLKKGKSLTNTGNKSLLSNKTQGNSFSLRSGYTFRGTEVINTRADRYINLNTVFTYQRGNTSYILPMKKKLILDNVKIDISNRQLRRN